MTPQEIKARALKIRGRLKRLSEEYPAYSNFRPIKEIMIMSDDVCELIVELAENAEQFAPSGHIEAPVRTER